MSDIVDVLIAFDKEMLRLDLLCAQIKADILTKQIEIGLLQQRKLIAEGKILFVGVRQ
jgi:hypothetical protein